VETSPGRHRETRTRSTTLPKVGTIGVAGVAMGTAVVLGLTPVLSTSAELTATTLTGTTWYLRGTDIGDEPTDEVFRAFMGRVFDGTGTTRPETTDQVHYNAGLWPFSRGGLDDLT
jgi:hypothetical protein